MFVAIILHFDNDHLASELDTGLVLFLHVGKLQLFSEILLLTLFTISQVTRGTAGVSQCPSLSVALPHTTAMHKEREGSRQSVPTEHSLETWAKLHIPVVFRQGPRREALRFEVCFARSRKRVS